MQTGNGWWCEFVQDASRNKKISSLKIKKEGKGNGVEEMRI